MMLEEKKQMESVCGADLYSWSPWGWRERVPGIRRLLAPAVEFDLFVLGVSANAHTRLCQGWCSASLVLVMPPGGLTFVCHRCLRWHCHRCLSAGLSQLWHWGSVSDVSTEQAQPEQSSAWCLPELPGTGLQKHRPLGILACLMREIVAHTQIAKQIWLFLPIV